MCTCGASSEVPSRRYPFGSSSRAGSPGSTATSPPATRFQTASERAEA